MFWITITLVLLSGCARVDHSQSSEANSLTKTARTATEQSSQKEEPAMTDYEPIPLDRLIGMAQLIVAGEVSKVKDKTFTLRPTLTLAGPTPDGEIEITKFIPDRFEGKPRAAPYKEGQSFLLFLTKDEKRPQEPWTILGVAGEGEMPYQDGFVYFPGRNVEGIPFQSYRVHEAERNIQRVEAPLFIDAIKRYRSCFAWKPGKSERLEPSKTCDDAVVQQYASSSPIHQYLARLTARRIR